MHKIEITETGKARVPVALIEQVQKEIDQTLAENPKLHSIDARTLIGLELVGCTWNFETGQVEHGRLTTD